ncbi:hypothetical protein CDD81_2484 [Ophiocordyceps australis]|uniref:Rhodopsin domain-containing protein n=1 Tax=Ophiocordyceps australis TaxID=1399860 RepID=A0A2C5YD30_9HYPO|nr:hypothetical protein CDD81_2484 [Ophiocordyceps australis]
MATPQHGPDYLAESQATLLNVFYSIPIPLELFTTAFRLYAKLHQTRDSHLAFDDYFMIFATIVAVAECITGLVYGAPYGLGRHIEAVSEHDLRMYLMGDYIFSHFYDVAIGCTKLSVLALYYRIFVTKSFRRLIIGVAIYVCLWLVAMEVVLGFGCRPIQAWWEAAPGRCVNKVSFTYFTNVTNLVTDLFIFVMPIPMILKLHTTRNNKISLCFLFSIGLGTCAISAARLSFVFGVGSKDMTWWVASLGILSAWEPCGGILCANLPVIYRPIIDLFKRAASTFRKSSDIDPETANSAKEYPVTHLNHDWRRLDNSSSRLNNHFGHLPQGSVKPLNHAPSIARPIRTPPSI